MTTLARIAIAIVMSLFASSCMFDVNFGPGKKGNGQIVEESRDVSGDFTEVSAAESLDVFVTQADEFKISVEADENVIDLIATDIKDGRLRVHTTENVGWATKKIYVHLPKVTALSSSSGADLVVQDVLEADQLELDASSGSNIQLEVYAQEINADTSSGADIIISGKTELLYADASSGADIRASRLEAKSCNANASSGSDISVNVSETLIADASSGADISYTGDASVQTNKSVSGSIHKN